MEVAGHRHAQAILTPEKSCGTNRTGGWADNRPGPDRYDEDISYFLIWSYKILQLKKWIWEVNKQLWYTTQSLNG